MSLCVAQGRAEVALHLILERIQCLIHEAVTAPTADMGVLLSTSIKELNTIHHIQDEWWDETIDFDTESEVNTYTQELLRHVNIAESVALARALQPSKTKPTNFTVDLFKDTSDLEEDRKLARQIAGELQPINRFRSALYTLYSGYNALFLLKPTLAVTHWVPECSTQDKLVFCLIILPWFRGVAIESNHLVTHWGCVSKELQNNTIWTIEHVTYLADTLKKCKEYEVAKLHKQWCLQVDKAHVANLTIALQAGNKVKAEAEEQSQRIEEQTRRKRQEDIYKAERKWLRENTVDYTYVLFSYDILLGEATRKVYTTVGHFSNFTRGFSSPSRMYNSWGELVYSGQGTMHHDGWEWEDKPHREGNYHLYYNQRLCESYTHGNGKLLGRVRRMCGYNDQYALYHNGKLIEGEGRSNHWYNQNPGYEFYERGLQG